MAAAVLQESKSLTWKDLDLKAYPFYATIYIFAHDIILYPADLLTTRLQNDRQTKQTGIRLAPLFMNIVRTEGVAGLYRGFGTFAVGSFPGQISYFMAYEYFNEKIRSALPRSSIYSHELLANAMAGVCAEAVSVFSYLPTDVVAQRLQVERKYNFLPLKFQNRDPFSIVKSIYRDEGLGGFFRGLYPYLIVYGPGSAIWWMAYEWTKRILDPVLPSAPCSTKSVQDHLKKATSHLLCGSLAGIASVMITNPLDVARTRLQLMEFRNSREKEFIRGGFVGVLRETYKNEGLAGLYKGARPRILIRIPGSALAFLGYEYLKDIVSTRP
jgi:solute carrier family 25 protein 44